MTGIDLDLIKPKLRLKDYYEMIKESGIDRAVKTLIRRIFFDKFYYNELAKIAEVPLKFDNMDIRRMDATNLQFENSTLDIVFSNATFEHINDVPKALSEVYRVMKKGGIACIGIHLFCSCSGGHNPQWDDPDVRPSKKVPSWDHLRQNLQPAYVSLNQLREFEYKRLFAERFKILEWKPTRFEGKALLTSEIRAELSNYSEDELTKRGVTVIVRK